MDDKGRTILSDALEQLRPDRYAGYGDVPIPDASDAPVAAVTDAYASMSDEPPRAPDNVSRDQARILVVFAERMATLALRTRDDQPLRSGLLAMGLAAGSDDDREILVVLPLYRHCANAIGVELEILYREIRRHLPRQARALLDDVIASDQNDGDIADIGYEVRQDRNGPRYVRSW